MKNLDIYCVTDKKLDFLEKTNLKLVGVGKEKFSEKYLKCDTKKILIIKKNIILSQHFITGIGKIYYQMKNRIGLDFAKREDFGLIQKKIKI